MKRKRLLAGILSVVLAINSNVPTILAAGGEETPPQVPSRSVTITASSETPASEEEVTLTAAGCEDADSLQWQQDEAGTWEDIEGETSDTYVFSWEEGLETASFRLRASWEGEEPVFSNELTLTAAVPDPPEEPGDTDTPEQPSEPQKTDGKSNPAGRQSYATFEEAAEAYYGEGGTQRVAETTVSMTPEDGYPEDGRIKAGQNLIFTVGYTLDPAASFEYVGSQQAETLFDAYENTRLVLTLPDGLTITTKADELDNVREIIPPEEGGENVWTIVLVESIPAATSSNGSFTLNALVEGNGTLGIGEPFAFGEGDGLLRLETSFTILDKSYGASEPSGLAYEKTIATADSLPDFISASDDQWGIRKTAVSAAPNAEKTTITVTFELAVGLLGADGEVISNASTYSRYGRVPFDTITLTETPSVFDRDGNPIEAESITVTPKFDSQPAVTVEKGTAFSLPVDTCEGQLDVSAAAQVDAGAPYYSAYTVELVYPYEEFIAKYSDADQQKLTVENTAQLDYTLKGGEAKTASAQAEILAGEVTEPAAIEISKYIVGAGGAAKRYSSANFADGDPVSGSVAFSIAGEDGSKPTLYEKQPDGTYSALPDNTVSFAPNDTGSVTVYLDPGTYTVTETAQPQNTAAVTAAENAANNAEPKTVEAAAGGTETAGFYNKEILGSVTILKTGVKNGVSSPLSGAVFGLYSDADCQILVKQAASNAGGRVSFSRLPYGTYYVREISAPSGYRMDDTIQPVTVSAENTTAQIRSVNYYNQAYVKLEKYLCEDFAEEDYCLVDRNNAYFSEFAGAFSIERETAEGAWETVTIDGTEQKNLSLSPDSGQILAALPVYDAEDNPITYRFAETLPAGYHAANGTASSGGMAYSQEFTLTGALGQNSAGAPVYRMYNSRNGSIEVEKSFYEAGDGQMQQATGREASFDLYYRDGDGGFVKYNTDAYRTVGGRLTITDLPVSGEGGAVRSYYLVERDMGDYKLTGVTSGDGFTYSSTTQISDRPAVGPFTFTQEGSGGKIDLSRAVSLTNVEQKVPVVVKKEDSYTGAFVPGVKYTIFEYSEFASDHKGAAVSAETEITSASGSFLKLDPGKKYIAFETAAPDRYTDLQPDGIVIDLTGITAVTQDTSAHIVTLQNRPDPKLNVTKFLIGADGTGTTAAGGQAEFEVYTRESDGSFSRVQYGGADLTVTNGTPVQLPAGTYYLKETKAPANTLDPAAYSSLYAGQGELWEGEFYFGPVTVIDKEIANGYGVENYSAMGAVQVKKLAAVANSSATQTLSGATIAVYRQGETEPVKTAVSGSDGAVTFTDLPIYGETGEKITYVIREIAAPTGYTVSDQEFTVTLEPGRMVTPDDEKKELIFLNQPKVSFRVSKVYYNLWEHQFTNKEYLLPDTVVALYQRTDTDTYTFVTTQTTNELGELTFTGLNQKDEYAAIEVSIPDVEGFEYLEPANEKEYLEYDADGKLPQTIAARDLSRYNVVRKRANAGDPVSVVNRTLVNVENWTQLQIEKYVMRDTDKDGTKEEVPVNNAVFQLYMEVLPEGTEPDAVLSFDQNHLEKYTFIREYSSGTLYDENGVRQDGWFATDILKSADEVVYWLVETEPGVGAAIKPKNAVTLIRREDAGYTNNTTYTYTDTDGTHTGTCTGVFEYFSNQVVREKIENDPREGPGTTQYTTVRIAKWAGSYDPDGNKQDTYTPLGNAVFDLYLVDEEGELLVKLDTLTTGLDNEADDDGQLPGDLTAWASSRAFSLDSLEQYREAPYGVEFLTDSQNNTYVRAALVEQGAPAGYQASTDRYYLYLFFQYDEQKNTEIFNDVFYVKEPQVEYQEADENGVRFALYPTKETSVGQYEPVPVADAPEGAQTEQFRLVNWPIDNFAVTVQKYGYEVTDQTIGKTSNALNKYFTGVHSGERTPLSVTMKLQRWYDADGMWKDYIWPGGSSAAFRTDENGYFAFPNGLPVGRYRIVETVPDSGYENIYTGAALSGSEFYNAEACYFSVTHDNVNLTLYNPKKLGLSIRKQDFSGQAVSGAQFTLTGKGVQTTDSSGNAVFTNLASGTYVLGETSAGTGYTSEYFVSWFRQEYKNHANNFADFVTSGIFLGFTTALERGEMIVKTRTDLSDYGITGNPLVLTVKNPQTVSLTVEKRDAQNATSKLAGARFSVEYTPFPAVDGTAAAITSSAVSWTGKGTLTTEPGTGQATLDGLPPGVYRVKETKAPDGYDVTDSSYRYIALTGGLNVGDVTVDGAAIQKDGNSSAAPLVFEDKKHVSLTVTKEINAGSLTVEGGHTFTFTLYRADKTTVVGTRTIRYENGSLGAPVSFSGLSQGATYYLAEEQGSSCFALEGMKKPDGTALTADEGGLYAVTIPSDGSSVSVTATNVYLYAEISVRKVNGNTGEDLSGADFNVYGTTNVGGTIVENRNPVSDVEFRETAQGSGVYTARIPLRSPAAETFRIKETNAPYGYLLNREQFAEVTLRPGQRLDLPADWDAGRHTTDASMLADRIFPNYPGAVIAITKYGGNRGDSNLTPLEGVAFTLYRKNPDGTWAFSADGTTDADGSVVFTVAGDTEYAVRETSAPAGYAGLQGLWSSAGVKAEAFSANVTGESLTLYRIGNGTLGVGTYAYDAYNTPYVGLEIRKQLVTPDGKAPPTATVSVYEVPGSTPAALTQQQVADLMYVGKPVLTDVEVDNNTGAGAAYSYANAATDPALGSAIKAGSSYLIVETQSSVPQLRDHKQVVWYKVLHVASEERGTQTVTLENIDASVTVDLEKKTQSANLTNLFESAADVEYTLSPKIANTYPLTGLTITDEGLAAYHVSTGTPPTETELSFDDYLKDKYSITSVTVPAATHDTSAYADGEYPITATVVFHGFDGAEIYRQTIAADAANRTVTLPSGKGKAKTVSVSYASEAFEAAAGYALGQNVALGEIKLTVHLDRQTATGAAVQSISKITNTAAAAAQYLPWGTDGAQASDSVEARDGDASASVSFRARTAAVVSAKKEAADTVALNQNAAYTITISNDASATAPLQEPFLVDFLPQGASLASTAEEIEDSITVDGTSQITFSHMRTATSSGETGVFVFLNGDLKPGDRVSVTLRIKAEPAVAAYGTELKNYVVVSSDVKGYGTSDNPQNASFKNSNGEWAGSLDSVLTTVSNRLAAFKKILAGQSGYGFISAYEGVKWTTTSSVVLVKSAYGDRNESDGYTTNLLSAVSNGGTMHYRLTISNTSATASLNDISVVDVLPHEGDTVSGGTDRYSKWDLTFGEIEHLYLVETTASGDGDPTKQTEIPREKYKVYYYTGAGPDSVIYDAVESLKFDAASLPSGWTDTLPADGSTVKAFVAAVDPSVEFGAAESLLVDYTATVNGGEDLDAEELSEISYTNAVNSFAVHCSSSVPGGAVSLLSLASNAVSATILPDPVKVGGILWIDKDADGRREEGETIDNFKDNVLIQDMLENVEVQLYTYRGSSTTSSGVERYEQKKDDATWEAWLDTANFVFEDLNAASLLDGLGPYDAIVYPDGVLDPTKLKGSNPSTYQLGVTLPETVKGLFRVTRVNAPVLYSRDPAQLGDGGTFRAEAYDNNFHVFGSTNLSEQFYLWSYPLATFDNTKDIGLVPYRTLALTKTSEKGDPLAGAVFEVYGPFEPDAASRPCTDANRVGTYTTGADGKITVEDLLWYMDYVVVEKTPPTDYTVRDAEVSSVSAGTNVEKLSDGRWLLRTPDDSKTDAVDEITVVNEKEPYHPPTTPPDDPGPPLPPPDDDGTTVSFTPVVRKYVSGDAREQETAFRFFLTADKNNPSGGASMSGTSVTVTGSGTASFGSIVFREPGSYLFYLREDTSQAASGYVYDAAVWTLRVSVTETDGTLAFSAAPVYESGGAQRNGDAQFINVYEKPSVPPETPETPGGEPETPGVPETGDGTGLLLWLVLLTASGTGLTILGCRSLLVRRRLRRTRK